MLIPIMKRIMKTLSGNMKNETPDYYFELFIKEHIKVTPIASTEVDVNSLMPLNVLGSEFLFYMKNVHFANKEYELTMTEIYRLLAMVPNKVLYRPFNSNDVYVNFTIVNEYEEFESYNYTQNKG